MGKGRKVWFIQHIVIHGNGRKRRIEGINLKTYDIDLIRRFMAYRCKVERYQVFFKGLIEGTIKGTEFIPNISKTLKTIEPFEYSTKPTPQMIFLH